MHKHSRRSNNLEYSPISDEESPKLCNKGSCKCGKRECYRKSKKRVERRERSRNRHEREYERKKSYRSERHQSKYHKRRERSRSRPKRDRNERKSKSKKKSSKKRRRDTSTEKSSSSKNETDLESDGEKCSSFISEILRNERSRKIDKIISKCSGSVDDKVSYTPPLIDLKIITNDNTHLKCTSKKTEATVVKDSKIKEELPKLDENGNIVTSHIEPIVHETLLESTEHKNSCKKKSVLELPMPPVEITTSKLHNAVTNELNISLSDVPLPPENVEDNQKSLTSKNQSINFPSSRTGNCELKNKDHFTEMQSHLKSHHVFTPMEFKNTPPDYHKPVRPSVIKKSNVFNIGSLNRLFESFCVIEQVGKGTYGKVYKAVDLQTKEMVAMKYIKMENEFEGFPITCLREIKILQQLNHPNIIKLRDIVFREDEKSTYLIFEYMNHDLLGLRVNNDMKLDEYSIYHIIRQVLEGLNYCHQNQIIHRDLKLSNILVNNKGEVKICDFGLSRTWIENRPYTNKVISLWYRPIEILLGEEMYGPPVDIWSVGCIIYELFKRKPLFPFSDEIEIVNAIFKLCGTPEYNLWPEVKNLPKYKVFKPKPKPKNLRNSLFPALPPLVIDLVDKMLTLNPSKRITAEDALKSNWITFMDQVKIKPLQLPPIDSFEMRARELQGHQKIIL